jgi:hypothetical protein
MQGGHRIIENARGFDAAQDKRVQKYLRESVLRLIKDLKI